MALYPSSPGFKAMGLQLIERSHVDFAHNGRRSVRCLGAMVWRFNATYNAMRRAEFEEVYAFAMALQGQYGSFTIAPPNLANPRGVGSGTPVVASVINPLTLSISGLTPNISGIMLAGDVFHVDGDNKVYSVVTDTDSNGSGVATFSIMPPLRKTPANGATITLNNVAFTMRLTGNVLETKALAPFKFDYAIDMVEALT